MRDDEMKVVLRALQRIKSERQYSLRGLARLLGVSAGHLSMIFRGQRRPGLRFLRSAMKRFPELRRIFKGAPDANKPSPED